MSYQSRELQVRTMFSGIRARLYARHRWQDAKSVFVLSTGRTGTTTVIALLNLSAEVEAHHEPRPRLLAEGASAYQDLDARFAWYAKRFTRKRRDLIGDAVARHKAYAEAMLYPALAPVIAKVMPNSRFLHLYRHPGDVVRSGMRRGWYVNHPLDKYRVAPASDDSHALGWDDWDPFARVCWYWDKINSTILQAKDQIPSDRFYSLSFEDMVNVESRAYRILFDTLDVGCPVPEDVKRILEQPRNVQKDNDFPRYSEWSENQRSRLHEIAGQTMQRLGYK